MNADEVADVLGLVPLELEGGMWAQTWRDERVIVVTGAGGGIGGGIARRLMAAGATVVAHTRSSPVEHLVDDGGGPVVSVAGGRTPGQARHLRRRGRRLRVPVLRPGPLDHRRRPGSGRRSPDPTHLVTLRLLRAAMLYALEEPCRLAGHGHERRTAS